MKRAIWKGTIKIAGEEIAVRMYSAVQDQKVHFRLLHAKDLEPVEQRIVRKSDGKEVPKDEQRKALPVEADTAVIVEPDELERTAPETSRDIDLCRFVPASALGDQWYDRPYYLGPDKDDQAYFSLVAALEHQKVIGIARWAMRKKRYVGALKAEGGYLMLITLRRADQVLSVSGIDIPAARQPDDKEVRLAEQLVMSISADFEPQSWVDEYRARVMKLIEAKARGVKIVLPKAKPKPAGGGLADMLQKSLAMAKEKKVA
ncbi:MAG TPA: Ku protein [Burkholderiales bacterium]|nr:Ku protein [Burkholderiales bacterium]